MSAMTNQQNFSPEQKSYLEGFLAGSGIGRSLTVLPSVPANGAASAPAAGDASKPKRPEDIHLAAQDRFVAAGKKLCIEENAKRTKHGLDMWDEVMAHAREARFPKGTDVFLFKFHGLFYVAPAQDAFMCRLRFAGGAVRADQLRGLAALAERFAGGYADITTRANLQLREIAPRDTVDLLMGLNELGIVSRGAGADNIRNITATPTTGFDPQELIDVGPLARQLHHYILNHRELYGLPRKFNVAFDSGGVTSVLEDTNDIGFVAVRIGDGASVPPGIYFRVQLGGITGHQQFARDIGVLLRPDECLPTAVALIRAFIDHGDRTDRKKARLKYVLDRMGFDAFVVEAEKHLPEPLRRMPLEGCEPRPALVERSHVGVHPQKDGKHYIGVIGSAGRLRADQLRALADIAADLGSAELRLTVWQNVLIPGIATDRIEEAQRRIENAGLAWRDGGVRAGLVACTGNGGCKFAASNTKQHALQIAEYVEARIALDQHVNVHLTGCPHSCAQHYIGDIGLLGTKVGEESLEGYHVYVGGGFGTNQHIGRELCRDVIADSAPQFIEQVLRGYMENRLDATESFSQFTRRHSIEELRDLFSVASCAVAVEVSA